MIYDVIIVGAGPAGISASLYTQRANLKTLIIYQENSALDKAKNIQNYYGFEEGISGKELFEKGIKQAQNLGVKLVKDEIVKIEKKEEIFLVNSIKEDYKSKVVILATGNKKTRPNIKGIEEFEGKGISYCAICDGFFYKNKNVAVVGSGNYAILETMELIGVAKNITILTNGKELPEYRAENVDLNSKEIKQIQGDKKVEEIEFKDNSKLKVDGIFIAEGVAGSTDFAQKLGAMTNKNNILVNENMQTTIKGLYACGDCTGGLLQVCKAVYEGATAGIQAIQYVRGH